MPGPYRDISHAKTIKKKEVPMSEAATNPRPKNSQTGGAGRDRQHAGAVQLPLLEM